MQPQVGWGWAGGVGKGGGWEGGWTMPSRDSLPVKQGPGRDPS